MKMQAVLMIALPALGILTTAGFLLASFGLQPAGGARASSIPRPIVKSSLSGSSTLGPQAATKSNIVDRGAYLAEVERSRPAMSALYQAQDSLHAGDLAAAEAHANDVISLGQQGNGAGVVKDAKRVLAEVRIRQDRYAEALDLLLPDHTPNESRVVDFNIALCYLKLGRRAEALSSYDPSGTLRLSPALRASDLPQGNSDAALEARIRISRGGDFSSRGGSPEALREYQIAERLAPNALTAYCVGLALADMGRLTEAKPYMDRAARDGSPAIAEHARRHLRVGN